MDSGYPGNSFQDCRGLMSCNGPGTTFYQARVHRRVTLDIRLECFSPMIPLDVPNSSIPAGTFTWTVSNPTDQTIEFALSFNISNPFGNLNYRDIKPGHPIRNTAFHNENLSGIYFENLIPPSHEDFGNMAVATDHAGEEIVTSWPLGGWWDDAHLLWSEFSGKGHFPVVTDSIYRGSSSWSPLSWYVENWDRVQPTL